MARQAGYSVTLKLFVPVDQKDISDTIAKAKAVQAAESGDLSRLMDMAEVEKFDQLFTSRNTGTGRAGSETSEETTVSPLFGRGGRGRSPARFEQTLN